MAQETEQDRLDRRLALLPMMPRAVFLLRRMEGLGYDEIGRRLGISRASAAYHMTRALHVLTGGDE